MLSARFRCIFWDNGWFGVLGTRFSQTLLKTQERVKTHTGAILVCFCCCVLPHRQIALIPLNFCFSAPGSVFCLSESMKKIRFSSLWLAILRDSHGCIAMHVVKIYRCDCGSFSGGSLPFLPVCCRDCTERVSAVHAIRDYGI